MSHPGDPAADVLARLDTQEEFCDSQPPNELVDEHGRIWEPGDCWCTRPPHHDGDCLCEVCHARHGTPGWPTPGLTAEHFEALTEWATTLTNVEETWEDS